MLSNLKIPPSIRTILDQELERGELIRWVGQPRPRFFTGESVMALIFGIPWTAFALFWTYGAAGFRLPNFRTGLQIQHIFALFGVPFILIGLGMLSSPIWVWWKAQHTVYLITNHRAILIEGGKPTKIQSYTPDQFSGVFREEWGDGTGNVNFAVREWRDSDGDRRTENIGFKGIYQAQDAERILKQLQKSHDP